jgi:hypothetical protein
MIHHNGSIQVNGRSLEGPGEYDIANIGIHVFDAYAILFSEGIRVAVFWSDNLEHLPHDEDSEIDICIPLIGDVKAVNTMIKEQDPRLVILHDENLAAELTKQDGITPRREGSIKITAATLPAEDRDYILLI